jgi:hypothetical protein
MDGWGRKLHIRWSSAATVDIHSMRGYERNGLVLFMGGLGKGVQIGSRDRMGGHSWADRWPGWVSLVKFEEGFLFRINEMGEEWKWR